MPSPPAKKRVEPTFDPNTTSIAKVREYLKVNARNGATCPCCRQWVQISERELTPDLGFILILLHRACMDTHYPIHLQTLFRDTEKLGAKFSTSNWMLLFQWKLIVGKAHPRKPTEKGHYRLTQLGLDFVLNKTKVAKTFLLYEGKFLGPAPDAEQVSVVDILGKTYVYEDLMQGKIGALP